MISILRSTEVGQLFLTAKKLVRSLPVQCAVVVEHTEKMIARVYWIS